MKIVFVLFVTSFVAQAATAVDASGAVYFQTNDPAGNHIIVHSIGSNGIVSFQSAVSTGGQGGAKTPGRPDALFSQSSVIVGGTYLYAVNAGSNSIATFKIDPLSPTTITLLGTVASGGEFPIALAHSAAKALVCALNGGARNGVQCFGVSSRGLSPIPSSFHDLGVPQTTPPDGPAGSLSDIAFSPDSSLLYVAVKGNPATGAAGFIATYKVRGSRLMATLGPATRTVPQGSALPFSLTPVPGSRTVLYTDPASGYGLASFASDGSLSASAIYPVPGQRANCWSQYSPATGSFFLSDPGARLISEVTVGGGGSALVRQSAAFGPLDFAIAGRFLYALSPGLTGIEVFSLGGPAGAVSVQQYVTSALTPLAQTVQGMAVFLIK